ncbi:DUF4142 domain-containing protein [Pseudonocardia sp.]|jgi:putative membrane protein|uniref:DUF4142 domain-containing protein n=1 Tax=Pseudonocardia sp. TaxID=60912 RepID=UPI00261ED4EC|nr:DUF4142 domain-containing protein [Pseudonocardia sp.]MCW2721016.1 hypothetical protein [Pseudonocardia sp.]MDT7613110.1 putative rane protein [Pseudonocardiales bacterium]
MRFAVAAAGMLGAAALMFGSGVAAAQTTPPPPPGTDMNTPPSSSAGAPGTGGQLSDQDRLYIMQNAQTDLTEITAGGLAAQRGTTAAIKQTAQTLISDHQQALTQLRGIAQNTSVTLPSAPSQMQQQVLQQLTAATGTAFDLTYLQPEISGHQESISQTQQELSSGSNAAVKQFASSYLPVAQKHLQLLQSDLQQIGGVPSGVSAGSGGTAAPWASPELVDALLGGGSLLVVGAGAQLLTRRRRA